VRAASAADPRPLSAPSHPEEPHAARPQEQLRRPRHLRDRQRPAYYYRLAKLQEDGLGDVDRSRSRSRCCSRACCATRTATTSPPTTCAPRRVRSGRPAEFEIPFKPARVVLQDFTGVPAVVDLAALRSAMTAWGRPAEDQPAGAGRPRDRPQRAGRRVRLAAGAGHNAAIEFERNRERYEFLRWGQQAFANFKVVPPASGIVHQVNLEYLSRGVEHRPTATSRSCSPTRWSAPTRTRP
jgi:aconitate hydratase